VGAPAVLHRGAHRGAPTRPWSRSSGGVTSAAAVGALVLLSAGLYHLDRADPASTPVPAKSIATAAEDGAGAAADADPARDTPAQRLPSADLPSTTISAPGSTTGPATRSTTRPTTQPALRPGCPPAEGPDLDGDGCPDHVRIDGAQVVVGDRRFAAGDPGDVVVVGDWTCDGVVTPAVLRPATGEVFVFPAWPAPGEDVVVGVTHVVAGAASLNVRDGTDGCAVLEAETADGTRTIVEPGP
jgi:hypothetical protein